MLKPFRPVAQREVAPSTDRGERIYAIGDIHGRLDLLRDLLDKVEAHTRSLAPVETIHVVLLGDLIDRGTQSAETLRYVHSAQKQDDALIVLLGNHEELMLKAIDAAPGALRAWMRMGGRATVRSFGLEPPEEDGDARAYAARLRATIPTEWLDWLRALPLTARSGDYLFCHAGVRPGVALKRQVRSDLLWIRDDFLEDPSNHGAVIVHGHSIANAVEMRTNRIGIDTGAYKTGVLTALYLEGRDRQIIATSQPEGHSGARPAR